MEERADGFDALRSQLGAGGFGAAPAAAEEASALERQGAREADALAALTQATLTTARALTDLVRAARDPPHAAALLLRDACTTDARAYAQNEFMSTVPARSAMVGEQVRRMAPCCGAGLSRATSAHTHALPIDRQPRRWPRSASGCWRCSGRSTTPVRQASRRRDDLPMLGYFGRSPLPALRSAGLLF